MIEVPWWADGWERLADVEEKLGNLTAARGALRFYLKAAPKASDRNAVEQRAASLDQRIGPGALSAPPPAAPAAVSDISGNWSTTDGRIMELKQNGNQVSWTACCKPGHEDLVVSVSGTFDGKTLVGTYHYREGQAEGSGPVTYVLDGDRLEGTWKTADGTTRYATLIRRRGDALSNLSGKWTTVSGRTLTLTQNGNQVRWTTCCRQSHPNWTAGISATFDGKNLSGTYHWRDGDKQGNGTVSYTLKGTQLEGTLETPGNEPYHSMLTRRADGNLTGKWTTSTGSTITLTQNGNQVNGTGCCRLGHPNWSSDNFGTFDGKNFVGIFHYRDGDARGTGTFIYTLVDGRLEGTFKPLGGGEETRSVLTRQTASPGVASAPTPPAPADLSGQWVTNDGRVFHLKQDGDQVAWSIYGGKDHPDLAGMVSGRLDGNILTGTYQWREGEKKEDHGTVTYALVSSERLEGTFTSITFPGQMGKWWTLTRQ